MLEQAAGAAIGIHLVNGKLRPRATSKALGLVLMWIGTLALFGFGGLLTYQEDYGKALVVLTGAFAWLYCMSLSPVMQSGRNYDISLPDGTLSSLQVIYKGKQVLVDYVLDENGFFMWRDNAHKLSCLRYADGSKMSGTKKYKVINYLTYTLVQTKLLSPKVTLTFES
jgi:hypothetical protein